MTDRPASSREVPGIVRPKGSHLAMIRVFGIAKLLTHVDVLVRKWNEGQLLVDLVTVDSISGQNVSSLSVEELKADIVDDIATIWKNGYSDVRSGVDGVALQDRLRPQIHVPMELTARCEQPRAFGRVESLDWSCCVLGAPSLLPLRRSR